MPQENQACLDSVSKMPELLELTSFKIGNEVFGVDISNVKEIIKMLQIIKVPNSPDFVEGIINLRGRVIPIIDLRCRLHRIYSRCGK